MESSKEFRSPAPEVFDEWFTPHDLACYFRQYAEEMVELGYSKKDESGAVTSPIGKGLDIIFDKDGKTVESVLLKSRELSGQTIYQISFSPRTDERGCFPIDGSSAIFQTFLYDEQGGYVDTFEFEETILAPENTQVNEFFRDMTAAIASTQPHETEGQ